MKYSVVYRNTLSGNPSYVVMFQVYVNNSECSVLFNNMMLQITV